MPLLLKIGNRLKRRRKALSLSQKDVAERVGTTQAQISRIEKGELNITVTTLERICKKLGLYVRVNKRKSK